MPPTLWKGGVSFGLVNISVGLYSAENRNSFDLQYMATHSKWYPEGCVHTTPHARMIRGARARLIRTAA